MSNLPKGALGILSWSRQGLAARAVLDGTAAAKSGRLGVPLKLQINAGSDIDVSVGFFGPGDVSSLDAGQVIRCEPPAGAARFEPNYLPAIEFDRPDLPWMFSPLPPDANGHWQPWLTLVVLPRARIQVVPPSGTTQPLASVDCPIAELPALSEAWAWAHAQVVQGSSDDSTEALLASGPRSLSRLVAARRLDARTPYLACVVPTYEIGRKAGLGLEISDADRAAPAAAWPAPSTAAADAHVVLPVYYQWEFETGDAGNFESLARLLAPRAVPEGVGTVTIDTSAPGWGMPALRADDPGGRLDVQGALRPPNAAAQDFPDDAKKAFRAALRSVLDTGEATTPNGQPVRLIGPPMYGQWYPDATVLPPENGNPSWFRELNLQVSYRIVAGLGTQIVRFEQDALMAAAWEQLASRARANDVVRRAQLTEATDVKARLSAAQAGQGGTTRPPAPSAPLGAAGDRVALRKLSRPGSALARKPAAANTSVSDAAARAIDVFGDLGAIGHRLGDAGDAGKTAAPAKPTELEAFAPEFGTPVSELLRDYFPDFLLPGIDAIAPNSVTPVQAHAAFVEALLVGLNHEMSRELLWRGYPTDRRGTYFRTFWDRRAAAAGTGAPPPDIGPIDGWAANSNIGTHRPAQAGATTDPIVFVIRGELPYRYPRASIHAVKAQWSTAQPGRRILGSDELQPLFRIDRAPDMTLIGFDRSPADMRGADSPAGDAGWFFVIQELPGEPRFGLEPASGFGGTPANWHALSWGQVAADASALASMRYLPLAAMNTRTLPVSAPSGGVSGPSATWAKSSADMAAIVRRLPFRLAIHARTWLA